MPRPRRLQTQRELQTQSLPKAIAAPVCAPLPSQMNAYQTPPHPLNPKGPGGCPPLEKLREVTKPDGLCVRNIGVHAGAHKFSALEVIRIGNIGRKEVKHVFTWRFQGRDVLGWNLGVMAAAVAAANPGAAPLLVTEAPPSVTMHTGPALNNFWIGFDTNAGTGVTCCHFGPFGDGWDAEGTLQKFQVDRMQ